MDIKMHLAGNRLFKFGVEKARFIMLIVIFIPSMLAMMLPQLGIAP